MIQRNWIKLRPWEYQLRYSWGGHTVQQTFRTRAERDAFREHIVRVWNARIIK